MCINDYIKDSERRDFCFDCNEMCSRHCPIYRKAENRFDEEMEREETPSWSERYLNTLGMSMRDYI